MFHWVRGVPFEFNAGAYDNLNMWEQIDNGDQYTPAKKFLLSVPIVLFLVSTHYTHYDGVYFLVNFAATLAVVVPKLPAVRLRRTTPFVVLMPVVLTYTPFQSFTACVLASLTHPTPTSQTDSRVTAKENRKAHSKQKTKKGSKRRPNHGPDTPAKRSGHLHAT